MNDSVRNQQGSSISQAKTESVVDEIIDEEGAPAWMVTFADMVTLLLVFFILLFSIATVESKKFQLVISSIQIALNENTPAASQVVIQHVPPSAESKIKPIMPQPGMYRYKDVGTVDAIKNHHKSTAEQPQEKPQDKEKEYLHNDIQTMIKRQKLGDFVYVYTEGDKVIIRIKGAVLFGSGDAVLFDAANDIFQDIYTLFEQYADFKIDIKGYTDNQPISTEQFPSNWELSAVRATTVLRYFVDKGIDPERLSATGLSDLKPIADNATEEGRAKNRRVEFVLAKEEK